MIERLNLTQRARLSEWMDETSSYSTFRDCLRDLQRVNETLRGYRQVEQWLEQFASSSAPLHIVDVGCGGGDLLRRLEEWGRRRNLKLKLIGIDINPFATRAAREFTSSHSSIEWFTGSAFSYRQSSPIDLVISSLFTHHLADDEIVRFLVWMERVSQRGWFINDLHRRRLPYYGFKALTWLRQWHSLIRHDGAISFRRSFLREDWLRLTSAAGLNVDRVRLYSGQFGRLVVSSVKG